VRVVGAGLSCSALTATDGCLIDLSRYRRMLAVDRDAGTATVEAGIEIAELAPALAERELALPVMGEARGATLGGELATATHGSGGRLQALAACVTAFELITADGSPVSLTAESDPATFGAALVGLGALGVVSTVTVRCVPAFNLRVVERPEKIGDVLGSLDARVDEQDYFEFVWLPFTEWALTWSSVRTDAPIEERGPLPAGFRQLVLAELAAISRGNAERLPAAAARRLARPGAALMRAFDRGSYVARGYDVMSRPHLTRLISMEYAVDRTRAIEAVRAIQSIVDRGGFSVAMPVEVRFSAADAFALSPSFDRDSCQLSVHTSPKAPYAAYFAAVEAALDELGGRPHWGMLHTQTASTLAPRYPKWEEFQTVREQLDPQRVFTNDYVARVLGS
jgi:FAD-linked oxidoreductase